MGNSGTTARLLLGLLAGLPIEATLEGDASLSQRPMRRVIEPLRRMGAKIASASTGSGNGAEDHLPITVRGGNLNSIAYTLPVASAQVKSALLYAGLNARGRTEVTEPVSTRDHTERILRYFGAEIETAGGIITLEPGRLEGRQVRVPGDISSAAFFLAAAAVMPGARVTVRQVGLNPTRTGFLKILQEMGAKIEIARVQEESPTRYGGPGGTPCRPEWEPVGEVTVAAAPLKGVRVPADRIAGVIDELPVLMAVATQAEGITRIEGAGELRVKETDRISSMTTGLTALGGRVRVEDETVEVEGPTPLRGARLESAGDHRTAMALTVAALRAEGPSVLSGAEWVGISFPGFFEILSALAQGRKSVLE